MSQEEVRVNAISELEFPSTGTKILGEGASGCVKLVRHKRLDRFFALKQLNLGKVGGGRLTAEKQLELVKREIKLHRKLVHPNIIRLYDYFKVKGSVFLLMEWAQKGTLYKVMKQKGKVGEEEAAKHFLQVCKGVQYLHAKNVIHRDLKVLLAHTARKPAC